jgi:hypothetical protein
MNRTQSVTLRACAALLALAAAGATTSVALGAPILFSGFSSDGHPVSGSVDFSINAGADLLTVTLANTTATTLDAGELLTGLDFMLGGLTPSFTSAMGIQRTVNGSGGFSDTGVPQSLSWSLSDLGGGNHQLNFNPNAKDSIIGPPTAGSYNVANPSVKGNGGHNPFAAESAVFVLSVTGLEANTPIVVKTWRYGTTLDAATPEPASCVLAALASAGLLARRRMR